MRLASVDIGTNTVRLLVADVVGDEIEWVLSDRAVVRLGEGLSKTGVLQKKAMERTLVALQRFDERCKELSVDRIIPIATAAVREASNREEFLEKVKRSIGWNVRVISGDEEAYLTYLGVKKGLNLNDDFLVFDIGGGSTEYICSKEGVRVKSLPIGVVKFTEEFIRHDPPLLDEIDLVSEKIRKLLLTLDMDTCHIGTVVGTAGTPTTLAAIDLGLDVYDVEKVHGYRLSLERLNNLKEILVSKTSSERLALPGVEKGREDLIVVGVLVVIETLKKFNAREMVVSEWGIREGVIIDAILEGKDITV